jgi:hypothetical protein
MKTGDVDGIDRVYKVVGQMDRAGMMMNFAADLKLEGDEKLVTVFTDTDFPIKTGWGSWGGGKFPSASGQLTEFYEDDGKGSLFVTDRRIVFLRRPDLELIHKHHSGGGNSPWPYMQRAKHIMAAGGLEYFEVSYYDVQFYLRKRWGMYVYMKVERKKYRMTLDNEETSAILPLMKVKGIRSRKPMKVKEPKR